jgi:hypothetical protein
MLLSLSLACSLVAEHVVVRHLWRSIVRLVVRLGLVLSPSALINLNDQELDGRRIEVRYAPDDSGEGP